MVFLFLAAFIGIPLIEIAVLIQVGGEIGVGATIACIVLTAVIGTALLRRQGFAVLARARANMDKGELPVAEVFDGICLLAAGAFLLTPGFVTDGVGFLLLVPPFRALVLVWGARRLKASGRFHVHRGGQGGPTWPADGGTVIDGDFDVVDDPGPDADDDHKRLS